MVVTGDFLQVGVIAMKDQVSGGYGSPMPLFIRADDEAIASQNHLLDDFAKLMARKLREYTEKCQNAGVDP